MPINTPERQVAEIHEPVKLKVATDVMYSPPGSKTPNRFIKTKLWQWYATDRRIVYQTAFGQADISYINIIQVEKIRYKVYSPALVGLDGRNWMSGFGCFTTGLIILLLSYLIFGAEEPELTGGVIFWIITFIVVPLCGYCLIYNWLSEKEIGICDCAVLHTQLGPIYLPGTENEINKLFDIVREEKENIIKMTQVKEVQRQVMGSSTRAEEVQKSIERLAELYASGYITLEEFKQKKEELLKQI